jgi:GDPmannose 4,6-dehydratase
MRIALITGITGQDGSYLAEFLLDKGYTVYGMKRPHSHIDTINLDHILTKIKLFHGDMNDSISISNILSSIKSTHFLTPTVGAFLEIYNLAAQSHVLISFALPEYTAQADALGTLRILEAIRNLDMISYVRFYQASSSEMFGLAQETPQTEKTPFYPRSPYGAAKLYAHWIVKNYREAYSMFTCSGILFNHESPRRGQNFVTRKITIGIANIVKGKANTIFLGNLDALRDWGHAKDYIEGMWLMLQQPIPDDFILSTGEQHSVREFIELAFAHVGKSIHWVGSGLDEKGLDAAGNVLVEVSHDYYRPTEVDSLLGDCTKAKSILSWTHKISFNDLVKEMVDYDLLHT